MILYLSPYIKFFLIKNLLKKNKYLLIYNKYRCLYIIYDSIYYCKYTNFISINKNQYNINNINGLINFIENWSIVFIKKVKFKGKGYKITKKKNFLLLHFNHAHVTWLLLFNIKCIKKSKSKYLFVHKHISRLVTLVNLVLKIRFINIYTKRGIALSKQTIFKKIGKRT